MAEKVNLAVKELENCVACPRNCKVNRLENKKGACNTGRYYFFCSARNSQLFSCFIVERGSVL